MFQQIASVQGLISLHGDCGIRYKINSVHIGKKIHDLFSFLKKGFMFLDKAVCFGRTHLITQMAFSFARLPVSKISLRSAGIL